MAEVLLSFRQILKICGVTTANDRISWDVQAGRIHALIGENGAGKSTLVKILFGLETADSGEIFWKGLPRPWQNPLQAKAHGLSMVHQHFMQAENMTALEHFALETTADQKFWDRLKALNWSSLRQQAQNLANEYQLPIEWNKSVRELSVGEQQRLEILKALSNRSQVLILDEPTAVLAPQEVAPFLDKLLKLKAQGITVILITHKLKEVLKVADTITVLRRGKLVWTGPAQSENENSLAEKMVGEDFHVLKTEPGLPNSNGNFAPSPVTAPPGLQVRINGGVHRANSARKIGPTRFAIRPGEIVGIAGVDGNGQEELVEALMHPQNFRFKEGTEILLNGRALTEISEADVKAMGRAWIPADRLNEAAVKEFTALENFVLGRETQPAVSRWGFIDWQSARLELEEDFETFDVRPRECDKIFSGFSGGNQQKIVAAREFTTNPLWICACHPTRGIDIMAARRIHDKLQNMKSRAAVTLLVSADLDELFRLCDRILVFYRGDIRLEVAARQFDAGLIGRAMAGLTVDSEISNRGGAQ